MRRWIWAGAGALAAWGCGGEASSGASDVSDAAGLVQDAASPGVDASGSPDAAGPAPDHGAPDASAADTSVPNACPVSFVWDPRTATALETFPDDAYTRPDPQTATGLRPDLSPARAPFLDALPPAFAALYRQLDQLDGWGTTAGIVLRFSGPVAAPPDGAIELLGAGEAGAPAQSIPFDVETIDDGAGLILWPKVPLRPATRHAVVLGQTLTAAGGGCVSPGTGVTDALAGVAPLAEMGARFQEALGWAGIAPEDAVGVAAFTTQSIEAESVAIAEDIAARDYAWATPPTCVDAELYRECDGTFIAQDYRDAEGVITGTAPVAPYELYVRAWLPRTPAGARPVVIFGPGIGADLDISRGIAEVTAPLNVVTVAIDAPVHGRHPAADPACANEICRITGFFAVDLLEQTFDPIVARDHFRESTYDKLQLVQLLRSSPDLDGDAEPDLDPGRMAYFAASLGGIMGPEFLALSPDLSAGLLNVPGGRVASIMADGQATALLVRSLVPAGTSAGDKARLFPLIQTLLERGDAANYAPHLLRDRLEVGGPTPPHLLMNMAMSDSVIPTSASRALARALRIPHVPPVFEDFGLEATAGPGPIAGNLEGGTTAGLFQFDRGRPAADEPVAPAEHGVGLTVEGRLQIEHFLQTWAETGRPEIIDPYTVLETPSLP